MNAPELLAAVTLTALILYALLGGADFGGGMWDLLAWGPRARQQRETIAHAIGPVWEANHVWVILVIVLLFSAFPVAFAALMTALHIPLTLVLVGIVLRGTAFVFRKYDVPRDDVHRRWSTVFGIASFFTPLLLGLCLGALASGDIRVQNGVVTSGFLAGWTTPFALGCGLFAQGLFAFLAATYLTVEVYHDPALQEDFRRRALFSGLSLAPAAALVFFLAASGAPILYDRLTAWWTPALLAATSVCALTALGALWIRRFALARVAAIGQVTGILLGWGLAHYPYLILPDVTFTATATHPATLRLVLWVLATGSVLLVPSFVYLFVLFKRP
jgi:cytochrome d ubiquinol oxidase subunit II